MFPASSKFEFSETTTPLEAQAGLYIRCPYMKIKHGFSLLSILSKFNVLYVFLLLAYICVNIMYFPPSINAIMPRVCSEDLSYLTDICCLYL